MSTTSHAPREPAAHWGPIDELAPWPGNPRRNDGHPVEQVAASIKRLGWGAPVVTRQGQLIAGHTRIKAAMLLCTQHKDAPPEALAEWHPEAIRMAEKREVPVRARDDLSEADANLLALADNRLGAAADWDTPLLAELLHDLTLEDAGIAGWDEAELDKLADVFGEAPDETDLLDAMGFVVMITCTGEEHQRAVLETCVGEGWECRALT